DAGKVKLSAIPLDDDCLVHQHANSHLFQMRQHQNTVVIAEDPINRTANRRAQGRNAAEARLKRPERPTPAVTCDDTNVVNEPIKNFRHAGHGALAYVAVQVAQVQNREAIESRWKS